MKTTRIVAESLGTAFSDNRKITALVAASEEETVEVLMQTMEVPVIVAGLIKSAQEAAKGLDASFMKEEIKWHFESSVGVVAEAAGFRLEGNTLCINIGIGVLFFHLGPEAQKELKALVRDE